MEKTSSGSARAARFQHKIKEILTPCDIRINGDRPWDIQVHDDRLYRILLAGGSLGLGEAYMDGLWDAERPDEFICRLLSVDMDRVVRPRALIFDLLTAKLINLQNPFRSFKVGEAHYDLGNRLFELMLDDYMIYSCGYWKEAENLNAAQQAKLELICRKLGLKPGMKVLDIGCGWGGTARYIAEKHGCEVTGVTISRQQAEYAAKRCAGLPIDIRLQDYRELNESFDRILSVGMFEHVGHRNYRTYMEVVARNLKDEGLFLLHTIGSLRTVGTGEPWLARYIFPNSVLPSLKQITAAADGVFVLEDLHNFGAYYDTTLMAWHANFVDTWPELSARYDERFRRMWSYFLLSCAGSFRARRNQVWQCVFSPRGVPGGYQAPR